MAERAIQAELQGQGRAAIVERGAIRMQVCADLYWQGIQATDPKNTKQLDYMVSRFGWLQAAAHRAWREVRAEREGHGDPALIIDAVQAAREVNAE